MLRWNREFEPQAENDEIMYHFRKQDDEFCRVMRAAIERGAETCPIGVSIEPCTKRPVLADGWKQW